MLPKQFDLTGLFETPFREARQPADPCCRFHHSRRWHLEAFEQPIEGRPAEASPLTAPIEPLEQNATGFVAVATQALGVSYDSIVVPMARILGPQGLHQLGKRTAPFGLDPFGEPLNRSSQFLATGAALKGGCPRWPRPQENSNPRKSNRPLCRPPHGPKRIRFVLSAASSNPNFCIRSASAASNASASCRYSKQHTKSSAKRNNRLCPRYPFRTRRSNHRSST